MRKRGFTLVELLVVIAIIAILAAMITPVLLEAKDAARMKSCVSNIRQLGMAVSQYMDDHGGLGLPVDRTVTPPDETVSHTYDNPWILYVSPLRSYIGQDVQLPRAASDGYTPPSKLWVCPGDMSRGPSYDDRPCWWHWGSSYMYPGTTAFIRTSDSDTTGEDITSKHMSCVPLRPMTWRCVRRDLLLADYWFDFHRGYKVPKDVYHPQILWSKVGGKRDVACINVIFLDLHAAAVTPDQRDDLIQNVRITDNPYYVPK